ncbi:MAG: hypothetical protein DRJ50_04980 [Actinobacteria bacterium]|nr:MAG: hypothetical protein DRJ50_04980 [Actinomycetota bacterium]
MTDFKLGDRIRYATTDDDGFPLVRYGFVGGFSDPGEPVSVMLDGELSAYVVDLSLVEQVHISNVTLTLGGSDLLDDPSLRQGLVNLWAAEAESAGLQIASLQSIGTGVRDSNEGYALAELNSGGKRYVLRGTLCMYRYNAIVVHAERPNRWDVA